MRIEIDQKLTLTEIMQQYNVSKATASRARKRGYLTGRSYQRGDLEAKYEQRMREILRLRELKLLGLTSVNQERLNSFLNKNVTPTKAEWTAFKSEIVRLRNDLRIFIKVPTEANFVELCADTRIKHFVLFEKLTIEKARKGYSTTEELQQAKIQVSAFYNALKIDSD